MKRALLYHGSDTNTIINPENARTENGTKTTLNKAILVKTNDEYTVGWICAVSTEYVAAIALLDEKHGGPDDNLPNNSNDYTLGRIGGHNVVIAVPSDEGFAIASAAAMGEDMMRSFPNIKIFLMVGIGGGAPTVQNDIRLGDVVVGVPRDGNCGVLQYDFGKTMRDQQFHSTRLLDQPPQILRTAINELKAHYECEGHQLEEAINDALERKPKLKGRYSRPSQSTDILYKSEIVHPHSDNSGCAITCGYDPSNTILRVERSPGNNPTIHYGLIASSNQVMKDAITRDKPAVENNILCFEMETAGLVNNFPYFVIRGICDYSDSHKGKQWQGYAAMAAAAYAKDLICRIRSYQTEALRSMPDVPVAESKVRYDQSLTDQQRTLLESLRFEEIDARYYAIGNAHARTCEWLLEEKTYLEWLDPNMLSMHHGVLWIKGKPGAGKSTLMKFAVTNTPKRIQDKIILSFFFNARGDDLEKSTTGMYRSLLLQLFTQLPDLSFLKPFTEGNGNYEWSIGMLKTLFREAVQNIGNANVICFIDALNECDESQIRGMISFFGKIGNLTTPAGVNFLVCFSSRHYPRISTSRGLSLILEDKKGHDEDIIKYISSKLNIGHGRFAELIRAEVREKSSGIVMWVVLVVDILNKEYEKGRIHVMQSRLHDIPGNLRKLLRDILTRDQHNRDELLLCIQWLLFSKQPLKPKELYFAVLSGMTPDRLPGPDPNDITLDDVELFILSSSRGLAEITKTRPPTVQFIHESVKDFFLEENGLGYIWPDLETDFKRGGHERLKRGGHERLKRCCLNYLNINTSEYLMTPETIPKASSPEAEEFRQSAQAKFPLLKYAVQNVIHHANAAELSDEYETTFFEVFRFSNWIKLNNIFEEYEIRRHQKDVSLIYILAKHNAGELIRCHPSKLSCFKVENERYGAPIFAALATNSDTAVDAFLEAQMQADTKRNPGKFQLYGLFEQFCKHRDKQPKIGADFIFPPYKDVFSVLVEQGNHILATFSLHSDDVDQDALRDSAEALSRAVHHGHADVIRFSIKYCPSPKMIDIWDCAMLTQALITITKDTGSPQLDDYDIIKLLLDHGAETEVLDDSNKTPLFHAVIQGRENIIRFLLDHGANIKAMDDSNQTPLFHAVMQGRENIVQLLLEYGANIEATDNSNQTPLLYASKCGNQDIVQLLLDYSANIEAMDNSNQTPIFYTIMYRRENIFRLLLNYGANIEATNNSNQTPLLYASKYGNEDIVQLLLDYGADIEALDNSNQTPIFYTIMYKKENIFRLLLNYGANIEVTDNSNQTPLLYASKCGNEDIVQLLLNHGANSHGSTTEIRSELDMSRTSNYQATTNSAQESAEQYIDDTATKYSDESSTAKKQQRYIEELAGDLFKNTSSLNADQTTQARISVILPELLKLFALKVGHGAQSQMHRDIMAFVLRHKREIAMEFIDIHFNKGEDDSDRSKNDADGMTSEDRINYWFKSTQLGQQTKDLPQLVVEGDKPISVAPEVEAEADSEDEEVPENWLRAYQEFFPRNNAYEWLLTRLQREFHLVPAEPNTMEEIRKKILASLPSAPRISRRVPSQSCRATFELDWDILDFFGSQGYEKPPGEVFEGIITITGSCWDAQAATCAQYIKQNWSSTGEEVIQLIKGVLKDTEGHSNQRELSDGTTIRAWINRPKFMVEAFGVSASIAEIGELFAWLGAALRASPRQNGLIYCVPFIRKMVQNSATVQTSELQPSSTNITYEIDFVMENVPQSLPSANGQCWHDIFKNPAVVKGYPIPRRTEWNTGLEISLNIMAGLARTRRLDQFKTKLYIKSFSTMLVPTKKIEDMLIWHLLYKKDGGRISYLDDSVNQEQHIGRLDLESFRHILGWCSEARLYAGSAEAFHPVTHSRLPKPHADCALAGASVSEGKMILSGPAFSIGSKDTPVYISRKGNVRRLKWISTKFILLWDERDKRGWLINGTSALLHVVRAFLSHAKDDDFKSAFCFKSEDLQEAENPHTAKAATAVLLNPHNRHLKLYEQDDNDEEYLLKTQIDHFYNLLEKLIDYQTDIASHSGAKVNDQPRRYLEGWDFEDLVTESSILYPRVATIEIAGKGWVDFIRAIHAVTLVGRGFGDIIQPTGPGQCKYWARLPTKQYYIASCASDLDRLMKEAGNHHDGHALLSDNLIFHTPTPVYMPCKCEGTPGQKCCEPVQTLFPSAMSAELLSREHVTQSGGSGAVIFGHNSHFPWIWGDTGPPQQGELMETESSSKAIGEDSDSGIGSSLTESKLEGVFTSQSMSDTERTVRSPNELHTQTTEKTTLGVTTPINRRIYTRNQYTVGIVCALAKELKAVRALFDNRHCSLSTVSGDSNQYALGNMAGHWVVATCLPAGEYGTNSAASVTANLKCSFSSIRFCLLVGIAGGVPSEKRDIRLGDVVVSQPTGTSSGVLQYDLGTEEEGNTFKLKGILQRPPRVLTTAINALQSDPDPPAVQLAKYLSKITDHLPEYRHPGQELDILVQAACEACATSRPSLGTCSHIGKRVPRRTAIPTIHYGLIASGNRVVKNVALRDRLAREYDVLCFEMEAAGVINTVDCLVIRGICDYCDSQKNDIWQEYAASTAAAYAKLLLGVVAKVVGSAERN